MQGQKLWIVVMLIAGLFVGIILVLLLSQSTNPYSGLAEFSTRCETQARSACQTTGQLPTTWTVKTLGTPPESCSKIMGNQIQSCSDVER